MKLQIISDLHSEFMKKLPIIKPVAETLVLAGDIGKIGHPLWKPMIDYFSNNWKHVIYVPGNHEYYLNCNIGMCKRIYREFFENYPNVTWLDNDFIETTNAFFIGSTLWSKPSCIDELNDFHNIKSNNQKLTLAGMTNMHQESLKFLEKTITEIGRKSDSKKCVIITHFPPTRRGTSDTKYINSPYRDYFANELSELNKERIDLWISGHTHYSYDFVRDGVRYYANQIGYPCELDNTDPDTVLLLQPDT